LLRRPHWKCDIFCIILCICCHALYFLTKQWFYYCTLFINIIIIIVIITFIFIIITIIIVIIIIFCLLSYNRHFCIIFTIIQVDVYIHVTVDIISYLSIIVMAVQPVASLKHTLSLSDCLGLKKKSCFLGNPTLPIGTGRP